MDPVGRQCVSGRKERTTIPLTLEAEEFDHV